MNKLVELSPATHRVVTRAMPAPETSQNDFDLPGRVILVTGIGGDDHGQSVRIPVQALTAL